MKEALPPISSKDTEVLKSLPKGTVLTVIRISGAKYIGSFNRIKDDVLHLYSVSVINKDGGLVNCKHKYVRKFPINTIHLAAKEK